MDKGKAKQTKPQVRGEGGLEDLKVFSQPDGFCDSEAGPQEQSCNWKWTRRSRKELWKERLKTGLVTRTQVEIFTGIAWRRMWLDNR